MRISLNDEYLETTENIKLLLFMQQQQLAQAGMAVAINNLVVPQSCWQETVLRPDDKLSVFRAIAGG
ncbi:sulfur carrier protein ThiS [Alteromonadaceae bacterium Bs31]|nr:sulfur carrier protein ThiS [Alteromonadaceae bacterium Bs31]